MIDNHQKAVLLYEIIESAGYIDAITSTSRVLSLANNIKDKTQKLITGLGLESDVEDLRQRKLDPTK